jgi:hypothetical protein
MDGAAHCRYCGDGYGAWLEEGTGLHDVITIITNEVGKVSDFAAKEFAEEWIAAWNAHDLERILSHYAEGVVLTSPVAARLLGDPSGAVRGTAALRDYFAKGLEFFPDLEFKLIDVLQGLTSVVLYYENQRGTKTGEFMEFDEDGKVSRVFANYSV